MFETGKSDTNRLRDVGIVWVDIEKSPLAERLAKICPGCVSMVGKISFSFQQAVVQAESGLNTFVIEWLVLP